MKFDTDAKWELVRARVLNLVGTEVCICYGTVECAMTPYHIHRRDQCHGMYRTLEEAKVAVPQVIKELLEMGVDP